MYSQWQTSNHKDPDNCPWMRWGQGNNIWFYGCFYQTPILVLKETTTNRSKHRSGEIPSITCFQKSNYTIRPRIKPFKAKKKKKRQQTIKLLMSHSYINNYQQHSLRVFLIDRKPTVTLVVSVLFTLQCQYKDHIRWKYQSSQNKQYCVFT